MTSSHSRFTVPTSDIPDEIFTILDHAIQRHNGDDYRTIRHQFKSDVTTLSTEQIEAVVDALEDYDREHLEDINHVWSTFYNALEHYPELQKTVNDRWEDVYRS